MICLAIILRIFSRWYGGIAILWRTPPYVKREKGRYCPWQILAIVQTWVLQKMCSWWWDRPPLWIAWLCPSMKCVQFLQPHHVWRTSFGPSITLVAFAMHVEIWIYQTCTWQICKEQVCVTTANCLFDTDNDLPNIFLREDRMWWIFYPADKIPHLCTCRCDTDLTISPFTTRGRPTFSDKEYALLRVPPVKPGRPPLHAAAVWKKYFNRSSTTIRFLTVVDLIAPRNNCRNNMCQSPWGALHPALHELRGYGWLKLYGMEGEGGHRCFSKAKGPCCCSPLLM